MTPARRSDPVPADSVIVGGRAIIVRVANGARPPTITLPAGTGALRLAGVNPGSREYLRASVDYDGIPEGDSDRFNLVIQRIRSASSELIEDQEIYRRASLLPDPGGRCLGDLLPQSRLVRAVEPFPAQRPDRSTGPGGSGIGYAFSNADGDDGGPLTDYDIIGSAAAGTGLFALRAADGFNFLCIPPLSREHDVGLSALLVSARYCRERHAMLIVDPPASWTTARAALDAMRGWPFRSEFSGSGECGLVTWRFLGLAMPAWVGLWALALGAAGVLGNLRREVSAAR